LRRGRKTILVYKGRKTGRIFWTGGVWAVLSTARRKKKKKSFDEKKKEKSHPASTAVGRKVFVIAFGKESDEKKHEGKEKKRREKSPKLDQLPRGGNLLSWEKGEGRKCLMLRRRRL